MIALDKNPYAKSLKTGSETEFCSEFTTSKYGEKKLTAQVIIFIYLFTDKLSNFKYIYNIIMTIVNDVLYILTLMSLNKS